MPVLTPRSQLAAELVQSDPLNNVAGTVVHLESELASWEEAHARLQATLIDPPGGLQGVTSCREAMGVLVAEVGRGRPEPTRCAALASVASAARRCCRATAAASRCRATAAASRWTRVTCASPFALQVVAEQAADVLEEVYRERELSRQMMRRILLGCPPRSWHSN
eukprot:1244913-Prymnesium_polylepis.1